MRQHSVRILTWLVCVTACLPGVARGESYFGFSLGTANASHPPAFRFSRAPRILVVPDTRVCRLASETHDADVFRFGGTWYAYSSGSWYRANDLPGTFHAVDVHEVPRAVLFVPPRWWKHHPYESPELAMRRELNVAQHRAAPIERHVTAAASRAIAAQPPVRTRAAKMPSSSRDFVTDSKSTNGLAASKSPRTKSPHPAPVAAGSAEIHAAVSRATHPVARVVTHSHARSRDANSLAVRETLRGGDRRRAAKEGGNLQ